MAAISRLEPTLGPDHTGLVLFDTLNGYLHSGNREKEQFLAERNILPNMTRLLEGARAAGLTTFYPSGRTRRAMWTRWRGLPTRIWSCAR